MAYEKETDVLAELNELKRAINRGDKDVGKRFGFFSKPGVLVVFNNELHRLSALDAAKVAEISRYEQGKTTAEATMKRIHELDNEDYAASQQPNAGKRGLLGCLR